MYQIAPEKKTAELLKELSLYSLIDPPSELELKRFEREAEKIKRIDSSDGYMLIGLVSFLKDDYQKAKSSFDNALANAPRDRETVLLNYSVVLNKLGRLSEGYTLLIDNYIQGSYEITTVICKYGLLLGLFEDISEYVDKLKSFSNHSEDFLYVDGCIKAFKDAQITQKEACDVYALLNEIYTKYKLSPTSSALRPDHEDDSLIAALYFKDISSDILSNLSLELIERLAEKEFAAVVENKLSIVFFKS